MKNKLVVFQNIIFLKNKHVYLGIPQGDPCQNGKIPFLQVQSQLIVSHRRRLSLSYQRILSLGTQLRSLLVHKNARLDYAT